MTSYRNGAPTGLTMARLSGDRVLGSRRAVAQFAAKPMIAVRRYCVPIACSVDTRADLYDLDASVRQFKAMESATTCSIRDLDGALCGSPMMTNAPYPVCVVHAAVISEFFLKQDKLKLARAAASTEQDATAVAPATRKPRKSVVYYVQLDTRVKIGTTTDIDERMKTYPPHARLLATEPGGYALEAKRHRQFNEYLSAGREWFDAGPRLRAHVESLMNGRVA